MKLFNSKVCFCEANRALCYSVQLRRDVDDDESVDKTLYEVYYPELVATFTGNLLADIMLYPLETIVSRLYLQVHFQWTTYQLN